MSSTLAALAVLLDGSSVSAEEQEYYEMLQAAENEPTTYAEAIGLDDYDVLNDR